jgi:hypothetical protein
VTMHTGRPLHRAVESEDQEHVRFLFSWSVNRYFIGAVGETVLRFAEEDAEGEEGHLDCVPQEITLRNLYEIIGILYNE